jgi:hypothetical protein
MKGSAFLKRGSVSRICLIRIRTACIQIQMKKFKSSSFSSTDFSVIKKKSTERRYV